MLTYIVRRLLLLIPTLLGVTAVVFFIMALSPGAYEGLNLNMEGAQSEGEEARRIRQHFIRRYGLDLPVMVQYGRWLNQISPIGFRMSSQVQFSDSQKSQASTILDSSTVLTEDPAIRRALDATLSIAAYLEEEPDRTARRLADVVEEPDRGFDLLAQMDSDVDEKFRQEFLKAREADLHEASSHMLDQLSFEAATKNRVLFTSPTVKWPDLGTSLRGRPVTELLLEAVPVTLLLNAISIPIIYVVAILAGIFAARYRGRWFDISSGIVFLGLWSIPVMWVGVMLIGFLANEEFIRWFPTAGLHDLKAQQMPFLPRAPESGFERGWLLDTVWHLILPVICLTYGGFAVMAKLTRASLLENMAADYVRTARAKGVSDHDVLFRHVLHNSLLPLITVLVGILPAMFAGTVIIETIFSISGMGKLGVEAAFMKDRELVMGTTLIGGSIGLCAELVRDVWYAMADPRVSYE